MAGDADVLELLRSRLADMEARQRSSGGTSASDFWERFAGRMPSPPSAPDAASAPAGEASRKGRGRRHRVAPRSRPVTSAHGPWCELKVESAESLDPRAVQPLSEAQWHEMVDDPAWITATAERAAARMDDCGGNDRREAIAIDAVAGFALDRHATADLTAAAARVAQQRRNHEVTLVNIVSELVSRGVDAPDGLSRADWLRSHDASLTAGRPNPSSLSALRWPTRGGPGCACSSPPSRSPSATRSRSSSSMRARLRSPTRRTSRPPSTTSPTRRGSCGP